MFVFFSIPYILFPNTMNHFVFKANKRQIQKAYDSYIHNVRRYIYYENRESGYRITMREITETTPFPKLEFNDWYLIDELYDLQKEYEWFNYELFCLPYCAWCYCERSMIADDNEHEECDMRMYYCSEEGVTEQYDTLAKMKPVLPTTALDLITSYLI